MSLGLAFEGCACRAAFHVGAVEWLRERGVRPHAVSGASAGAMVAVAVSLGLDALEERWGDLLGRTRVFQPRRLLRGVWPFAMSDVLGDALARHFGETLLSELPLPTALVVTHLSPQRGRERRVLTRAHPIPARQAVLASSFIPGPYHRLIRVGGRLGVDGAWQVRTPVVEARDAGATHVLALVSDPQARLIEGLVRERAAPAPSYARVFGPASSLTLGSFDFDATRTRAAFAAGRSAIESFARREQAWLEAAI